MKITENEMRGLLAGKCVPGDMKVNEELPAYLVRKFFALQQKLDVAIKRGDACMQAEMAWEKAMMAAIGEDGPGCVTKAIAALKAERDALAAENAALNEMYRHAVKELDDTCFEIGMMRGEKSMEYAVPETPATDAYFNSVRADAVEAAAIELYGQGYIFDTLMAHAAKLRSGEAK